MSKLVLEDGREFKVKDTLSQTDTHWIIDGREEPKEVSVLLYRHLRTPDGTTLISSHRHDYKTHLDVNGKEYMLDGGLEYLRCSINGDEDFFNLYNTDSIVAIRQYVGRSGYGKDGRGPYRAALLKDMSDQWVKASILFVLDAGDEMYGDVYQRELDYRKEHNIKIEA